MGAGVEPPHMSPQRVADDGLISEPGEYVLEGDRRAKGVTPPSQAMIRIRADDVTLDGQGHALVGKGVSDTTAVAVTADRTLSDVTVTDLRVAKWEYGLRFGGVDGATARDLEVSGNSYGLLFESVSGGTVDECAVRENLVGVYLGDGVDGFEVAGGDVNGNRLRDVHRDGDGG